MERICELVNDYLCIPGQIRSKYPEIAELFESKVGSKPPVKDRVSDEMVYEYIVKKGRVTVRELSTHFDRDPGGINTKLKRLMKCKYVMRSKHTDNLTYIYGAR